MGDMSCGIGLMCQRPDDDVRSETERFFPFFRRIAVHFGICPAVRRIAFERIVHDQASIMKEAVAPWGIFVVLMGFGRPGERRTARGRDRTKREVRQDPGRETPSSSPAGTTCPCRSHRRHRGSRRSGDTSAGSADPCLANAILPCPVMKRMGNEKICSLPMSTGVYVGSTSMPVCWRTNRRRLTSADGSLYQSPPPAYFTRPMRTALAIELVCARASSVPKSSRIKTEGTNHEEK